MTTSDQRPGIRRSRPDPAVWEDPPMRRALATQDVTTIYRLLSRLGFSQQHIAALTGQSQPEVSAIIHGRKVMAYDVLSRICDGLGAPRAYMGLAYDETTQPPDPQEAPGRPAQVIERRDTWPVRGHHQTDPRYPNSEYDVG